MDRDFLMELWNLSGNYWSSVDLKNVLFFGSQKRHSDTRCFAQLSTDKQDRSTWRGRSTKNPLDRLELSWLGKLNIDVVNTRLAGKLSLAGENLSLACLFFFPWLLDSKNKLWSDYEQSPFPPLRDSRSKRTRERARKSSAAWKRDARVNSR